jgi:acetyl-CoA decarbonylase/synthase complex subunit delta
VALKLEPKKWAGSIRQVTLGADCRRKLVVGGDNGLPLHAYEAQLPSRPALALEVPDIEPPRWPDTLHAPWDGVLGRPAEAARRAVEEYGADLVMLDLIGTHRERGDSSPEQAEANVKAVLDAVDVPLIVKGPGGGTKQNDVLSRVAESCQGQGLVLHSASQEDYKTLAAVSVAYGHVLVAESPIDLNIAKQMNILLSDVNVDLNRVLIDPLTGALGYGLEYAYSVMERMRLAALGGDQMLNPPVICTLGDEVWRVKEVKVPPDVEPLWGDMRVRGIHWEVATALSLIEAGASVLTLRHPESLRRLRSILDAWFGTEERDAWL